VVVCHIPTDFYIPPVYQLSSNLTLKYLSPANLTELVPTGTKGRKKLVKTILKYAGHLEVDLSRVEGYPCSQAVPTSLQYANTASDQRLEVGTAWE